MRPRQWQGQEVVWPTLANVIPEQLCAFKFDSGIHLTGLTKEQAQNLSFRILLIPPPAPPQGAVTTMPAAPPANPSVVQSAFDAMQSQWLPPGTFRVQFQDASGAWQTAADNVQVTAGQVVDVQVGPPPTH